MATLPTTPQKVATDAKTSALSVSQQIARNKYVPYANMAITPQTRDAFQILQTIIQISLLL